MKSCRNTFYQTFNYRKKLFYVVSSFLLSIALMCTGVFDLTCLLAFERPDLTTHNAMATIMVRLLEITSNRITLILFVPQILHVLAFYLSLFGFVHSFEAKQHILSNIAVLAGGKWFIPHLVVF